MSTRNTLFQKPTVEIDQDRYEELIRHECNMNNINKLQMKEQELLLKQILILN